MSVQVPNGVVDIAVEDETEAVAVAKKYLSYFQGPLSTWEAARMRRRPNRSSARWDSPTSGR